MPWTWVSAVGWLFSRVALLDERHVDGLARDGVNRFRQRGDRRVFRFVGGRDDHGQHLAQRINRHVDRAPRAVLLPVIASTRATFRRRCIVYAATIAAPGADARPSMARTSARRP